MKLPAGDPMLQLTARLTLGHAELPEHLECWVCVISAHGALHLCEHLSKMMKTTSKCRLVGCSDGNLAISLGLRGRAGH